MLIRKLISVAALVFMLVSCNKMDDKVSLQTPVDAKAEQIGLENIRLTWVNSSKSYDGVIIERASQEGGWVFNEIGRVPEGVFRYDDNAHDGDAFYQYRLTTYLRDRTSSSVYVTFRYSRLPAPTEFKGELTKDGYVMTWKDNCQGEDGYVVMKGLEGESLAEWKVLGADVETVTDQDLVSQRYEYEVYAYAGEYKSSAAGLKFDNTSTPRIKYGNVTPSWHQVHVQFNLDDDGGFVCEAGVCWRTDGGKGANTNDNCYTFPGKIRTGDPFFALVQGLVPGQSYYLRPWIRFDGKYQYYSEVKAELMAEPEGLYPDWTDVSRQYKMPASIRLYKTQTNVTGRNVRAWYAVADMSTGNLELRTFMLQAPMKPSEALKELAGVQIMVNGGYFSVDKSASYVMDQGNEISEGIRNVKCSFYVDGQMNTITRNYIVTRGAFGVNQSHEPSVKWLYGSRDWAYDAPLPVINGGPVLQPSATFPAYRQRWDVYSAIGGGPVVLHDGHLCIDYLTTSDGGGAKRYVGNPEMIGDDVFGPTVRIARTAIGHTADGKIVIMVVEANDSSQGVSLDELARLMKGAGCTDVLNLDGGESSAMCVATYPGALNTPTSGVERDVVSFVALVAKEF